MTDQTTAAPAAPAAAAATLTAAPAAAPVAAPAPAAPAPAPAAANWFDTFQDPQLREWVQSAGVKDAESAASKALNLERMLGADRAGRTVVIPADPNDAAAWGDVHAKLGRPASAEGYKLPVPEGADPTFSKTAAKWFHAAGLSEKQAQSVSAQWNDHVTKQQATIATQEAEKLRQEHAALEADWGNGPAYELQKEIARRAAVKLGLDANSIDALEKVVGYSKVMKAFATVGKSFGESETVGLGESSSFGLTPEAARGEKSRLMADPEWRKRAMNPASAEWTRLKQLDEVIAAQLKT